MYETARPLNDKVLVRLDQRKQGTIEVVGNANTVQNQGTVISVGRKVRDVRKGWRVLFENMFEPPDMPLNKGVPEGTVVELKESEILARIE
jgi:co-chaperonin GroES (HSP10)